MVDNLFCGMDDMPPPYAVSIVETQFKQIIYSVVYNL